MTSEEFGAIAWAVGRELAKGTWSENWEGNFSALQKYYAVHGHFQICKNNDPKLSAWAYWQRTLHRQGTLKPEREQKLNQPLETRTLVMLPKTL